MNTLGKTAIGLAVVWLALMVAAGFGAFTGDTSLLVVAIVCSMPIGFAISMLMQQIGRK